MADKLPDDFDDSPDWSTAAAAPLDPAAMLKVARARLGLTQDGAAALLGVPVTTLRNWEQRRFAPEDAAKTLIRLLYRDPETVRDLLRRSAA